MNSIYILRTKKKKLLFFILQKTCSHVNPMIDSKYTFSTLRGIPCFKHKLVRFVEVISIAAFVLVDKNVLLRGNIFRISCQALELSHSSYLSSLSASSI